MDGTIVGYGLIGIFLLLVVVIAVKKSRKPQRQPRKGPRGTPLPGPNDDR